MEPFCPIRVLRTAAIAVPACALVAGVMYCAPRQVAFAGGLVGVALFMAGADLHYRWCAAVGGVLMFGSVLAWALHPA